MSTILRSKKSYKFSNEEPSNSKIRQKGSKRYKFDFNSEEQEPEEPHVRKINNLSYNKTSDSLDNISVKEERSPKKEALSQLQNFSTVPHKQIHLQAESTAENIVETEEEELENNFFYQEQFDYTENFLGSILDQNEIQQFYRLVEGRRDGKRELIKDEAFLFLSLNDILQEKNHFNVNDSYNQLITLQSTNFSKEMRLKRWAIYLLRNRKEFNKIAQEKKTSKEWMMLAEGKIEELADMFIKEENYEEAILISNIEDRAFQNSHEISKSKALKKQINLLVSGDIAITPNIAWPVDLAIALSFFQESQLAGSIQQLFTKYQSSKQTFSPSLEPSLLLLALAYKVKISDTIVLKMIKQEKRLAYLRQVMFLYSLKPYKSKFPRSFKQILQNLAQTVKRPELFVSLLTYSEVPENDVQHYLHIFLSANDLKSKQENTLYKSIHQNAALANLQQRKYASLNTLYHWMFCEKYLAKLDSRKYYEALEYYEQYKEEIKSSRLHSLEHIYSSLVANITQFEVACTYKPDKREKYYQLLLKLQHEQLNKQDQVIVQGCIAFQELKQKIFFLHDSDKLDSLYQLYLYLKRHQHQNANTLTNLRKTVQAAFETLECKVYLNQESERFSKERREQIAEAIKRQLKQREDLSKSELAVTSFFKILEIANWNNKLANLIVIKLLFY